MASQLAKSDISKPLSEKLLIRRRLASHDWLQHSNKIAIRDRNNYGVVV
jgi:hypothetical protein